MHKRAAFLFATSLFIGGVARARPVEAIDADRVGLATDLRDLDRRSTSLSEQVGQRHRMLKQRVRSLYKLAHGGSLRMLVDADSPEQLTQRLSAAQRVVNRDLHELAALDEETTELSRDDATRTAEALRASQLEIDRATAARQPRIGIERRRGELPRPVPGPIVVGFARTRVATSTVNAALELPRRNVEMAAAAGDAVRAVGKGIVTWVGGSPDDAGTRVVIDHGNHYVTVTGRLGSTSVTAGQTVNSGESLGTAAGPTITFELSEGRTALDPSSWMRAPSLPSP